jgi:hypothetical protein
VKSALIVTGTMVGAVMLSGCSSGGHAAIGGAPTASAASAPAPTMSSPSTSPAVTPTVFDCGGGAYKPATLLIVCGVDSSVATGVRWADWSASGATGEGSVALTGHAAAPADLRLGSVVSTSGGPQFSSLTVTWTGPSPDGHPTDTFRLDTASQSP